ncbi:hypothetical protein GCM10007377_15760 [Galliscardovia ingluviei]|uniref:Uncharacterized protein n=1 Tax=Galliscardovia ingluviei TaxID=1769422 RepID=A0A8J3EXV9_9BIFI|nr:hypothetical protein [Galliscardovia ingluviei]GGI15410.1 hypothetical protein GCM10007377_15760 [Galliscardovia ingluviei]
MEPNQNNTLRQELTVWAKLWLRWVDDTVSLDEEERDVLVELATRNRELRDVFIYSAVSHLNIEELIALYNPRTTHHELGRMIKKSWKSPLNLERVQLVLTRLDELVQGLDITDDNQIMLDTVRGYIAYWSAPLVEDGAKQVERYVEHIDSLKPYATDPKNTIMAEIMRYGVEHEVYPTGVLEQAA